MPGPQIKDWNLYRELRGEGYSKKRAAQIANARARDGKKPPLTKTARKSLAARFLGL